MKTRLDFGYCPQTLIMIEITRSLPQLPELTSTRVRRTRLEHLTLPSESLVLTHRHLCKQFSLLDAKPQARLRLWRLLPRFLSWALPVLQIPSAPSLSPRLQISAPTTRTFFLVNRISGTTCLPPCLPSSNQLLYSPYLLRYLMHSQPISDPL